MKATVKTTRAIVHGLRRVSRAPALVFGLFVLNLAVAVPAALLVAGALEGSIGPSLFHQTMRDGFDADWYADFFVKRPRGLAATFRPSILGAGAVYDNLEAFWSGRIFTDFPPVVYLAAGYALLWLFCLGGVLMAWKNPEGPRYREGFFAACGRSFGRFLQLALVSGVLYFLLYALSRWLFGRLDASIDDVTEERPVFLAVLAIVALTVVLLHLVRMVFDYAKIAVVLDDESAPRALLRALGFVRRNPGRTVGVYTGVGVLAVVLVVLYALVAPGAGQSSFVSVLLAFLLSQVYLVARLALRLALLASEVALYRTPEA